MESYGVVWREGNGPIARGKLELLPRALRLDGMTALRPAERDVLYDELELVRVGRQPSDRIAGRPSLVLVPRGGEPIAISTVAPGIVGELADRVLALRRCEADRRTAIVLPLREGTQEAVRALLAAGPPFDPAAVGLERHQVFLTATEAVFVFEAGVGVAGLEQLLSDPELWQLAQTWGELLAGPPRIAESVYSWTRPVAELDPALLPPGLADGAAA